MVICYKCKEDILISNIKKYVVECKEQKFFKKKLIKKLKKLEKKKKDEGDGDDFDFVEGEEVVEK